MSDCGHHEKKDDSALREQLRMQMAAARALRDIAARLVGRLCRA